MEEQPVDYVAITSDKKSQLAYLFETVDEGLVDTEWMSLPYREPAEGELERASCVTNELAELEPLKSGQKPLRKKIQIFIILLGFLINKNLINVEITLFFFTSKGLKI